ncbi:hypothetical protein Tco_0681864 [Tanacetum coccineum]|uniref:Uncharacterized protein n=1 Tax=Tanacetum coccineum TaxID=301880 RepID=A0ABQ4XR58_9ASTR
MLVGIEESRHGPSDAMHNPSQSFEFPSKETCGSQLQPPITKTKVIRVILFSIHSDDGNLSSVNIKQHCGREIVSLRSILWEIDRIDEEEEVAIFQDKYEHVGQKHKMIKKLKSR